MLFPPLLKKCLFQGGKPVNKENSIQVVKLVLKGYGSKPSKLSFKGISVKIIGLDKKLCVSLYLGSITWNAKVIKLQGFIYGGW